MIISSWASYKILGNLSYRYLSFLYTREMLKSLKSGSQLSKSATCRSTSIWKFFPGRRNSRGRHILGCGRLRYWPPLCLNLWWFKPTTAQTQHKTSAQNFLLAPEGHFVMVFNHNDVILWGSYFSEYPKHSCCFIFFLHTCSKHSLFSLACVCGLLLRITPSASLIWEA